MKVRVSKELYDRDHNPIVDEHGRQKEIGDAYLFGGVMYPPGAEIDMPDDVAKRELAICGQRQGQDGGPRHPHLESCEFVKEREMSIQERKAQAGGFDPLAFQRKQQELEAQLRQSERQRQLVHEREEQLRGQNREMEEMRKYMRQVEEDNERRLRQVEEDNERRLRQVEEDARRREAELRRGVEAAEARAKLEAEEAAARAKRETDELRAQLEEAQKAKLPGPARAGRAGAEPAGAKGDVSGSGAGG